MENVGTCLSKHRNIPKNWKYQIVNISNTLKMYQVYHNDLKPEHFTLKNGYIYLIDYGLATFKYNAKTKGRYFEKPVKKFLVSAGIYVIEPHLLEGLILNKQKDMPEFIRGAIDNGKNVAGFPIYEYWLDIGQIEEFKQASGDYERVIAK